uniref:Uncharacterized protein n=1 Tax=Arundo donax TaxID=35708 RepID=A0A0A9CBI8_ARUDO
MYYLLTDFHFMQGSVRHTNVIGCLAGMLHLF